MRALWRMVVAAAVALATVGGGAPAGSAVAAEIRSGGLEGYGACLAANGGGDLLLLVDESQSLRQNDPQDARVTAASYMLDRLAGTAAAGDVALDVSIATFSADFTAVLGWTTLDAEGLQAAKKAVATLAERDRGLETDYWNALEGSRRVLADRSAAAGGEARCQAVAWFSDGALDIEPRNTEARRRAVAATKPYAPGVDLSTPDGAAAAEAAARDSLCRGGGLADQVRASGIWTLGVGLTGATSEGQDFAFMRSIATGADPSGVSCGDLVDPPPGEFALASDIDQLLFAVERMVTPGKPTLDVSAGVCQGAVCVDQAHRFVLDASIRSVHVLGFSDVPGVRVVLVSPDGTQWPLDRPETAGRAAAGASGAGLAWTWPSERTLSVDLTRPEGAAGWPGQWSLVFVDDSATSPTGLSRSNISITGDIVPTMTPPSGVVHVGEAVSGFRFGLAEQGGAAIDPASLLGSVSLSAVLTTSDGRDFPVAEELTAEGLAENLTLDLTDVPPGEALVRLALSVTTAAAQLPDGSVAPGTALAPQRVDIPLTLRPPPNYPSVDPRVDFGQAEGAAQLSAVLHVTGPGCVWVDPRLVDVVASPAEAGTVTVDAGDRSSAQGCLEVGKGEEAELPLTLTTEAAGNGSVNGALAVALSPTGEPERATIVEVPFAADLRKPLNRETALGAFIAALVLGPGIPLGLLWLLKRRGARIPPRALSARRIPVTVTDSQVLRDGVPFAFREDDFVELVALGQRGARTVTVNGVTLRTHVGASPFGAGSVLVDAPGHIGASPQHPEPVGKLQQARLPLAVHNTWAVMVDPAGPEDAAELLVHVAGDSSLDRRRQLSDDVVRRAPELIRSLHGRAASAGGAGPAQRRTAPSDPFKGGASHRETAPPPPFGAGSEPGPRTNPDPFDFSFGNEDQPR